MDRRIFLKIATLTAIGFCGSCRKARIGSLPWWTSKVQDVSSLGIHGSNEKGGQIYTLNAGPIDVSHARIVIDDAKYLYKKIHEKVMNREEKISFRVADSCSYLVELRYPFDGAYNIDREVSIELSKYFSYIDSVWHEVRGFYGRPAFLVVPDFPSAFSCEDNVSNALGAKIYDIAMRDSRDFDLVVSEGLERELKRLRAQPVEIGKKMARYTRGQKHFDVGLRKGYLVPWNVPRKRSLAYGVPGLGVLSQYGVQINWKMFAHSGSGHKALKSIGAEKSIDLDGLCDIVEESERNWNSLG